MTPQLQQAIKLLQLSNIELAAFVEEELARNPMLEREEGAEDAPAERTIDAADTLPDGEEGSPEETVSADDPVVPDSLELAGAETMPAEEETPLDMAYTEVWTDEAPQDMVAGSEILATTPMGRGGRTDFEEATNDIEGRLSREKTLREHLGEQLSLDIDEPAERLIGLHLIDLLDEAGWLQGDLASVAQSLGCSLEQVEKVLAKLQSFDPPGVFARDLRECLALQLRERGRLDPPMEALLDNLEALARRDKTRLLKVCGVDAETLAGMVAEIRSLNPKPAQSFVHEVVQTMTPDILMRPHPDGGWMLELNPETLPRVLVNTEYYTRISRQMRTKEEREYVNERFQSANWLVKALHQRATTILKVAREIVVQQDAFFAHGVEHLKPLVLRDIADAIQMHESTVSRVTTNKFIATPRGTFELKYFFTSAIQSVDGRAAHSAEAVRFRIKSLIENESPQAVLSDDRIVDILKQDGIDIARRTVAKYRESMRIASSVERRRMKSSSL